VGDEKPKTIRQRIYKEQERGSALRREWHEREMRQRRSQERVYFIQCEAFVKIGYSYAPWMRIDALRTANPFPCVLLGTIPGGSTREFQLHNEFSQYRHQGEWFHFTPEVRDAISELLNREGSKGQQLTPKLDAAV
jgi:hypothetical protein